MDFEGKTLSHCSFSYTGLTNQQWIVFLSSTENLHDSVDFTAAANEWIELSFGCVIVKIDSELFKNLSVFGGRFIVLTRRWGGEWLLLQSVSR